ncbi:hypothetical protein ACHAXN_012255 [Cyclotella atomus]
MKGDGSDSTDYCARGENALFASPDEEDGYTTEGYQDFINREKFIQESQDYLQDGALVVKIQMKLHEGAYHSKIYPKCPSNDYDFSEHLCFDDGEEGETSDITFKVKGTTFSAHKFIIKTKAEELYVMCQSSSKSSPFEINDVDSEVFGIMLSYLYGGNVLPEDWQRHSKAILKAVSKYGFTNLKEEAEFWYARSLKFTVDNVIDDFMEADGNSYPLVRDAAKKFILEHGEKIVESDSFAKLHESLPLMKEVMAAAFKSNKRKRDEAEG